MRRSRFLLAAALCTAIGAGTALASWYDDYDAGLTAARKGQWQAVVQKMTAAIGGNAREGDRTRTYGAIFISYHPYYYRGVANLNLGKYDQAIKDFETTSGPGEDNLGSIDVLMSRAKTKLAETTAGAETPVTTPTPTRPTTTQAAQTPERPAVDTALRNRARAALDQAKSRIQGAAQRKATSSPAYNQALQQYTEANTRWAGARSNDDLNAVLAAADNITMLADSAQAPGLPTTPTATVAQTRPAAASNVVLGDTSRRVRQALESYFNGDLDEAANAFQTLSRDLPNNPWIWAFLGASQYSQYAFEADETYKAAAVDAFKRAKRSHTFRNGLPEKYFSKKIRKAFNETAG